MSVAEQLQQECRVLFAYLFGIPPGETATVWYVEHWQQLAPALESSFGQFLFQQAMAHPWLLASVDVGTRWFDPTSCVRHKLNFSMAIGECHPDIAWQMHAAAACGRIRLLWRMMVLGIQTAVRGVCAAPLFLGLWVLWWYQRHDPFIAE